jgi:peptide chain release factor 2
MCTVQAEQGTKGQQNLLGGQDYTYSYGIVTLSVERSQHQNREVALRMLKSKLIEIKEREHLDKIEDIKGDQKEIGWVARYAPMFYALYLVKDHERALKSVI